jgi:flotillin
MTDSKKLSSDVEVTSSSPDDHRIRKPWGYIAAYPHEYLIHFRRGRLSNRTSGQGARCYKLPADTVFIIPTSLKEIVFQANQLSADNVDVRIRGMAIYRIADPLRIYTMLNFSDRQRARRNWPG